MRILVLGAGAIGGYFGGRLVASGADVTFLVRPRRAELLKGGLRINSKSDLGDLHTPIRTICAGDAADPFDAVILSNKAYDLDAALADIGLYLGDDTLIIPLLNGLAHIATIEARYPQNPALAGTVACAAKVLPDGTIQHLGPLHRMAVGLRPGQQTLQSKAEVFHQTVLASGVNAVLSGNILAELWEKYIFLAALAAATCVMRDDVGTILATDYGKDFIGGLINECMLTAAAEGHPYSPPPERDFAPFLLDPNSTMTASMLRDMDARGAIEADHILGDMIRRASSHGIGTPNLKIALTHLQVYEASRD